MENLLFKECLAALQEYRVLTETDTEFVYSCMQKKVPFLDSGSVDWEKISHITYDTPADFMDKLQPQYLHTKAIIIWDSFDTPAVETTLLNIFSNIDDVSCVSVHKYILVDGMDFIELGFIPENIKLVSHRGITSV